MTAVEESLEEYRRAGREKLQGYPLTKYYFAHLIEARLRQNAPGDSPIIRTLNSPIGLHDLEERLRRTCQILNFEKITLEVNISNKSDMGQATDEYILDAWAEILVADILLNQLHFQQIEKVIRGKNRPKVDFLASAGQDKIAIEVARLRRREFKGVTWPGQIEECYKPENICAFERGIHLKIKEKNKQLSKFFAAEGKRADRSIVALKTSQWEYQDCNEAVTNAAQAVFNNKTYSQIDELLIVYDVEQFNRILNLRI